MQPQLDVLKMMRIELHCDVLPLGLSVNVEVLWQLWLWLWLRWFVVLFIVSAVLTSVLVLPRQRENFYMALDDEWKERSRD